ALLAVDPVPPPPRPPAPFATSASPTAASPAAPATFPGLTLASLGTPRRVAGAQYFGDRRLRRNHFDPRPEVRVHLDHADLRHARRGARDPRAFGAPPEPCAARGDRRDRARSSGGIGWRPRGRFRVWRPVLRLADWHGG